MNKNIFKTLESWGKRMTVNLLQCCIFHAWTMIHSKKYAYITTQYTHTHYMYSFFKKIIPIIIKGNVL